MSEMRITDAELGLIKMTFADNDNLLKLLRKIFFPEIELGNPIGSQVDLWTSLNFDGLTPEQAISTIKARQMLVQHVEMCLLQLKLLAGKKEESVEQTKEKLKKDSSK